MRNSLLLLVAVFAIVSGGLLWFRGRPASSGQQGAADDAPAGSVARGRIGAPTRASPPKLIADRNALSARECDEGNLEACTALGGRLWGGLGNTQKDAQRALALFKAACEKGQAEACGNAGGLLLQGSPPVVRDARAALVYLDRACTQGVALACSRAQSIFELGIDGLRDPVKEEAYHAKARALGLEDP